MSDADGEVIVNYERDDIIMMSIYGLQTLTFVTCVCFRYFWYREVGLYSLQVGRPPTYICKHGLHLAICLLLLPNFFVFTHVSVTDRHGYERVYSILRLVSSAMQIVIWCFSSLILRFEYRRALGHVWYMHPTFFWVSAAVYAADATYC